MTKEQFERQLQIHGSHLPEYWLKRELLEWLWSLLDPKLKEE